MPVYSPLLFMVLPMAGEAELLGLGLAAGDSDLLIVILLSTCLSLGVTSQSTSTPWQVTSDQLTSAVWRRCWSSLQEKERTWEPQQEPGLS